MPNRAFRTRRELRLDIQAEPERLNRNWCQNCLSTNCFYHKTTKVITDLSMEDSPIMIEVIVKLPTPIEQCNAFAPKELFV